MNIFVEENSKRTEGNIWHIHKISKHPQFYPKERWDIIISSIKSLLNLSTRYYHNITFICSLPGLHMNDTVFVFRDTIAVLFSRAQRFFPLRFPHPQLPTVFRRTFISSRPSHSHLFILRHFYHSYEFFFTNCRIFSTTFSNSCELNI